MRGILTVLSWALAASATILENGQVRENPYPGQLQPVTLDDSWRNYPANAPEISYKGRWDSQHISCMFPVLFPRISITLILTLDRVVVRITFCNNCLISRVLINSVHLESKSSFLGKRCVHTLRSEGSTYWYHSSLRSISAQTPTQVFWWLIGMYKHSCLDIHSKLQQRRLSRLAIL